METMTCNACGADTSEPFEQYTIRFCDACAYGFGYMQSKSKTQVCTCPMHGPAGLMAKGCSCGALAAPGTPGTPGTPDDIYKAPPVKGTNETWAPIPIYTEYE